MESYRLAFELYGKKMQTTIQANSEAQAKDIIRNKIIFHKVEKKIDDYNDGTVEYLKDMFGMR